MFTGLRAVLDASADLFLGSACVGCGRPGWGACRDCVGALSLGAHERQLSDGTRAWPVIACCSYRPPVPALIKAWKDEGSWGLTSVFADRLAEHLGARGGLDGVIVVPAPSRRQAVAERGHDHAGALARQGARRLGWVSEPLLRVSGPAADQFDLTREARWLNMKARLRAQPGRGRVLLVDDVITTGATLTASAMALTDAGWTVMGAATVASSELRLARVAKEHRTAGLA